MNCPYIFPAADAKLTIVQNKLPATDNTTITFVKPLPSYLVTAINSSNVEAGLGCSSTPNKIQEYVRIQKGSYNSENNTVKLKRGLSPYADNFGGEIQSLTTVSSGAITLDFGKWRPYQVSQLVNKVCDLDNNAIEYISKNLPVATESKTGGVVTAYKDPTTLFMPSKVITTDNPAFTKLFESIYGVPNIDYSSAVSAQMQKRMSQITQILQAQTKSDTRFNNLLTQINSLPF
jgi:hypothetical protein